jgi:rhamnose utilization protein RhaD (predicted bifunctional aldolase and dehydrogenase)
MNEHGPVAVQAELQALLDLTERVGSDPLLTQASTGNSSMKLDGVLWIKASGRWMADALRDDILIPLNLAEVRECLRRGIDPTERYPHASLETAMHAALPHRVVLHVHCVNTIAWAVRSDAPIHLQRRLDSVAWQWIPYVASGLPLARDLECALSARPDACVFVLGNHGLVVAGDDIETVEAVLREVRVCLDVAPRRDHAPDYPGLLEICSQSSCWDLPDDRTLHGLGTDPVSRSIHSRGLLYPCQAIFSECRCENRPFMIVEGRGVLVNKSMAPAELAMLSGLAQVLQRLNPSSALRYLTETEVAAISTQATDRYRELARASRPASRWR